MPRIRFARIVILESIPPGQMHTGRQLYEILQPVLRETNPDVTIDYLSAATKNDFESQLQSIYNETVATARIPLLHVECHGNDQGLDLANGEFVYWEDLYDHLVLINEATGFDLFLSISACFGAYVISQLNPIRRAPFSVCLSVTKTQFPDELYRGFYTFYRTLLRTNKAAETFNELKSLNEAGHSFYLGEASDYFRKACKAYFTRLCTPEKYEERITRMQEEQRELKRAVSSREVLYELLVAAERPYFERFRRAYFMLDLFPENGLRFPVEFEEVRQ